MLVPLALFVASVSGDIYVHNPRGSNNRLNEKSANRNNGDRLFDSQNNNRGGYNVGDKNADAFDENSVATEPGSVFTTELNEDQYSMIFYENSILGIEWTAQHGCGGSERGGPKSPEDDPNHLNCNMVLQYTCNTDPVVVGNNEFALNVELKDGRNTGTPNAAGSYNDVTSGTTKNQNDNDGRGRHESEGWYYECQRRARNKGLFLADQKLNGNDMTRTRQNPNGNRRGLECPEERDYYPHWLPSPWIDIAYLTDQVEDCVTTDPQTIGAFGVVANSGNVKEVGKCTYYGADSTTRENAWAALTPEKCNNLTANGATGVAWLTWSHNVPAPVCQKGEWSRSNHLGNGVKPQPLQYNWTIPRIDNLGKYVKVATAGGSKIAKCVLRVRYNISTDDYDPRLTNSSHNENIEQAIVSPVEENPTVDIGLSPIQGLRLAINTNQFGRTFQDRSHTFYIKERPTGTPCTMTGKMWNLNVRGKRGNIVQTFPSVEYDYQPNQLEVTTNDCIHIQWTGSNTHDNGSPAGDGQAGDAGEGTGGTDRHNIVCLADRSRNYPVAVDLPWHNNSCMFINDNAEFYVPSTGGTGYMAVSSFTKTATLLDAALYLGSSGYYKNEAEAAAATTTTKLDELLNNAPASLIGGVIMKPLKPRMLHYMCTRNNNFSNRSQKGTITVFPA